jgi:transposase
MGRGREGPKDFLGRFAGILQTDGYVAYERVGGTGMVHAACRAHARRKFFDAVKLSPGDLVARQLVERIDDLFAIDAEARDTGMDHAERHVLRGERSRPLIEIIRIEMTAAQLTVLPSGALERRSPMRSRCGTSSPVFWNIPNWN